jgi:hypothetical protein
VLTSTTTSTIFDVFSGVACAAVLFVVLRIGAHLMPEPTAAPTSSKKVVAKSKKVA